MSFLKKIFSNQEENQDHSKLEWILITHIDQLDYMISKSWEKPILIFKHSTRCGISKMALKQFENGFSLTDQFTAYFLDLLEYREISNEIAACFGVMHQSPQLIVIKNGVQVHNVSHSDIATEELQQFV